MNEELEKKLVEKYPTIFRDVGGDLTETCMAMGLCCGAGWYGILDTVCAAIMKQPGHEHFKAEQIKEKFGELRFYGSGGTPSIHKLVDAAERASSGVCEDCGSTEDIAHGGKRWLRTLCPVCRQKYDGSGSMEEQCVHAYEAGDRTTLQQVIDELEAEIKEKEQ